MPKKKHWIKKAIKHPGAFKAQAKRAGKSVAQFASETLAGKRRVTETTKRRARLARTLRKLKK